MKTQIRMSDLVADHIVDLVEQGNRCPKTADVLKILGGKRFKGLLSGFLHRVRYRLEREYDLPVCCINDLMYKSTRTEGDVLVRKSFLKEPPESVEEASLCLPGQGNGPIAGVWVPPLGKKDLIYQAYNERLAQQSAKEIGVVVHRTGRGIRCKILPPNSYSRIRNQYGEGLAQKLLEVCEENTKQSKKTQEQLEQLTQSLQAFGIGSNNLITKEKQ